MSEQSELEKWAESNVRFGSDLPTQIEGALKLLEVAEGWLSKDSFPTMAELELINFMKWWCGK